jgi:hypothetical protein
MIKSFTIVLFATTYIANANDSSFINFSLIHHDKEVHNEFVFNKKDKTTYSSNCFSKKNKKLTCEARKMISSPLSTKKNKSTSRNVNTGAHTCKYNLGGKVLYFKSESKTLEGFCYFEKDKSSVSIQSIQNRYKNNFIKK